MSTTQVISPVEFDEALYQLHVQRGQAADRLTAHRARMHTAAGDRKRWVGKRQYWTLMPGEVMAKLNGIVKTGGPAAPGARELLAVQTRLEEAVDAIVAQICEQDEIYDRPENRWPRYYRCLNPDGHIHSSLRGCSSVSNETAMGWNTDLSGKPVEAAIAKLGKTLCSICFPDAPAEHCQKLSDITRADRELAKAAKLEAKYVKRLRPEETFRCDSSWVETVYACKEILRKEVEFRDYLGRGPHPWHPVYVTAAEKARAVLLARDAGHGGMTEAEIATLIERAVAKNRKENAR